MSFASVLGRSTPRFRFEMVEESSCWQICEACGVPNLAHQRICSVCEEWISSGTFIVNNTDGTLNDSEGSKSSEEPQNSLGENRTSAEFCERLVQFQTWNSVRGAWQKLRANAFNASRFCNVALRIDWFLDNNQTRRKQRAISKWNASNHRTKSLRLLCTVIFARSNAARKRRLRGALWKFLAHKDRTISLHRALLKAKKALKKIHLRFWWTITLKIAKLEAAANSVWRYRQRRAFVKWRSLVHEKKSLIKRYESHRIIKCYLSTRNRLFNRRKSLVEDAFRKLKGFATRSAWGCFYLRRILAKHSLHFKKSAFLLLCRNSKKLKSFKRLVSRSQVLKLRKSFEKIMSRASTMKWLSKLRKQELGRLEVLKRRKSLLGSFKSWFQVTLLGRTRCVLRLFSIFCAHEGRNVGRVFSKWKKEAFGQKRAQHSLRRWIKSMTQDTRVAISKAFARWKRIATAKSSAMKRIQSTLQRNHTECRIRVFAKLREFRRTSFLKSVASRLVISWVHRRTTSKKTQAFRTWKHFMAIQAASAERIRRCLKKWTTRSEKMQLLFAWKRMQKNIIENNRSFLHRILLKILATRKEMRFLGEAFQRWKNFFFIWPHQMKRVLLVLVHSGQRRLVTSFFHWRFITSQDRVKAVEALDKQKKISRFARRFLHFKLMMAWEAWKNNLQENLKTSRAVFELWKTNFLKSRKLKKSVARWLAASANVRKKAVLGRLVANSSFKRLQQVRELQQSIAFLDLKLRAVTLWRVTSRAHHKLCQRVFCKLLQYSNAARAYDHRVVFNTFTKLREYRISLKKRGIAISSSLEKIDRNRLRKVFLSWIASCRAESRLNEELSIQKEEQLQRGAVKFRRGCIKLHWLRMMERLLNRQHRECILLESFACSQKVATLRQVAVADIQQHFDNERTSTFAFRSWLKQFKANRLLKKTIVRWARRCIYYALRHWQRETEKKRLCFVVCRRLESKVRSGRLRLAFGTWLHVKRETLELQKAKNYRNTIKTAKGIILQTRRFSGLSKLQHILQIWQNRRLWGSWLRLKHYAMRLHNLERVIGRWQRSQLRKGFYKWKRVLHLLSRMKRLSILPLRHWLRVGFNALAKHCKDVKCSSKASVFSRKQTIRKAFNSLSARVRLRKLQVLTCKAWSRRVSFGFFRDALKKWQLETRLRRSKSLLMAVYLLQVKSQRTKKLSFQKMKRACLWRSKFQTIADLSKSAILRKRILLWRKRTRKGTLAIFLIRRWVRLRIRTGFQKWKTMAFRFLSLKSRKLLEIMRTFHEPALLRKAMRRWNAKRRLERVLTGCDRFEIAKRRLSLRHGFIRVRELSQKRSLLLKMSLQSYFEIWKRQKDTLKRSVRTMIILQRVLRRWCIARVSKSFTKWKQIMTFQCMRKQTYRKLLKRLTKKDVQIAFETWKLALRHHVVLKQRHVVFGMVLRKWKSVRIRGAFRQLYGHCKAEQLRNLFFKRALTRQKKLKLHCAFRRLQLWAMRNKALDKRWTALNVILLQWQHLELAASFRKWDGFRVASRAILTKVGKQMAQKQLSRCWRTLRDYSTSHKRDFIMSLFGKMLNHKKRHVVRWSFQRLVHHANQIKFQELRSCLVRGVLRRWTKWRLSSAFRSLQAHARSKSRILNGYIRRRIHLNVRAAFCTWHMVVIKKRFMLSTLARRERRQMFSSLSAWKVGTEREKKDRNHLLQLVGWFFVDSSRRMLWKGFQKWVLVAKAQKRLLQNSVKAWIKRLHRLTLEKLKNHARTRKHLLLCVKAWRKRYEAMSFRKWRTQALQAERNDEKDRWLAAASSFLNFKSKRYSKLECWHKWRRAVRKIGMLRSLATRWERIQVRAGYRRWRDLVEKGKRLSSIASRWRRLNLAAGLVQWRTALAGRALGASLMSQAVAKLSGRLADVKLRLAFRVLQCNGSRAQGLLKQKKLKRFLSFKAKRESRLLMLHKTLCVWREFGLKMRKEKQVVRALLRIDDAWETVHKYRCLTHWKLCTLTQGIVQARVRRQDAAESIRQVREEARRHLLELKLSRSSNCSVHRL